VRHNRLPGLKPSKTGFDIDNRKYERVITVQKPAAALQNQLKTSYSTAQPAKNRLKTGFNRKSLICFPQVPLYAIPEAEPVVVEDDVPDEDDEERPCPLDGLDVEADDGADADAADRSTVAEVVLVMLDWMGDHKSTWSSSEGVWEMLKSVLPKDCKLCVFSRVKAILVAHLDGRLVIHDVCPCGYTVYMDCTSRAFGSNKYKNSHRTACPRPKCGLSRHLPGTTVARKVPRAPAVCTVFTHTVITDILTGDVLSRRGGVGQRLLQPCGSSGLSAE